MIYSIDKNQKDSAYMQLYKQIRRDIVNGVYKYGSRLPSKRLVATETGVSVITTQHAYELLCDEGYAESRQRSGYYVIYTAGECLPVSDSSENIRQNNYHNVNTEFPFSVYSKTVRKVLSEYGDGILVKSPNNGCRELRQAIASYLGRSRGITVEPKQIVIGSGAEYLYSIIIQTVGRSRGVAIEDPSYEKIRKVYVDPVAIAGIVLAMVFLVCMVAGTLQMQLSGDPTASIGLGSITYVTKTANGFIALDGNMRDVVLWTADGTWLGAVEADDLFGTDYPWLASADVMDDGSILCIMTTERLDKSADELVAFRISGF